MQFFQTQSFILLRSLQMYCAAIANDLATDLITGSTSFLSDVSTKLELNDCSSMQLGLSQYLIDSNSLVLSMKYLLLIKRMYSITFCFLQYEYLVSSFIDCVSVTPESVTESLIDLFNSDTLTFAARLSNSILRTSDSGYEQSSIDPSPFSMLSTISLYQNVGLTLC